MFNVVTLANAVRAKFVVRYCNSHNNIFSTTFIRWIKFSEDLKEIDLEDNLIGELGGREILDALHCRKEGLPLFYVLMKGFLLYN